MCSGVLSNLFLLIRSRDINIHYRLVQYLINECLWSKSRSNDTTTFCAVTAPEVGVAKWFNLTE